MSLVGRKTFVRTSLLAAAAGAAVLAFGAPAFAAIPHVTVTPHRNLTGGQKVTVGVTHFPANTSVTIIECNGNGDGDLANCKVQGEKKAKTDSKGSISGLSFTVRSGNVGNGTCGTGPDDKFCSIAAISTTGQMQQTEISFKLRS